MDAIVLTDANRLMLYIVLTGHGKCYSANIVITGRC